MDSREKFSGKAKYYTAGRTAYPQKLIDYLCDTCLSRDSVTADIGAGTGLFARQLLERGQKVLCVEPNDDMRRECELALGNYDGFKAVKGDASNTTLGSESVDFVSAAQAFHWFNVAEFKAECKRILKEGGAAALIWNTRDVNASVNLRCAEICKKYCPDFKGFNGGEDNNGKRIGEFFEGNYKMLTFENDLFYNREKFFNHMLSSSYALNENDKNYPAYIDELGRVFEEYAENGVLRLPNNSELYIDIIK